MARTVVRRARRPTPAPDVTRARRATAPALAKGLKATVPIVLVGAMAVTFNLAGPGRAGRGRTQEAQQGRRANSTRTLPRGRRTTPRRAVKTAAAPAPVSYTVKAGDTVSSIAGRYGLSTASVLALNGLGWKSLIFPGQVLKLTSRRRARPRRHPRPSTGGRYTIQKGDTITRIAARFGVSTQAVLTANGLGWSSIIYPGQTIAIPGAALAVENVSSVTPGRPARESGARRRRPRPPRRRRLPPDELRHQVGRHRLVDRHAVRRQRSQAILDANGLALVERHLRGPHADDPRRRRSPTAASPRSPTRWPPTPASSSRSAASSASATAASSSRSRRPCRSRACATSTTATATRSACSSSVRAPDGARAEQILDPVRSATRVLRRPANPNKGKTRGLLDIPGWESMPLTVAAQKVQISAFPDAYAKWETSATAWLAAAALTPSSRSQAAPVFRPDSQREPESRLDG